MRSDSEADFWKQRAPASDADASIRRGDFAEAKSGKTRGVAIQVIDDLRLTIDDSLVCALARGGCRAIAKPIF